MKVVFNFKNNLKKKTKKRTFQLINHKLEDEEEELQEELEKEEEEEEEEEEERNNEKKRILSLNSNQMSSNYKENGLLLLENNQIHVTITLSLYSIDIPQPQSPSHSLIL